VHPPPFLLPGSHFLAAQLWLGIAALGLVWVAPHLAAGNIFDPRVFALTHAITLGVITTAIFGALYQLFPVTMGRAARRLDVAYVTFVLLQAGTVFLVTGFWFAMPRFLAWGWSGIGLATLLLGINLISRCGNTQPDPAIGRYVGGGYLALVAALCLGLARIGEALGHGQVDRLAMIASHFHLAAAGFASLVVVGVGHRMLPMFLVSHGFPRWPFRWIGLLMGPGLVLFPAGLFAGHRGITMTGGGLIALAGAVYLYLAREYFRRRVRRQLDPGLAHVAMAHLFLGAGLATGLALLARGGLVPRWWAGYAVLLLLGWLVLLIVGVLYKILPFLTWLHLFGANVGTPNLPTVADLTQPTWGRVSLGALSLGILLLAGAIGWGRADIATGGAIAFALGVGLVLLQALRVFAMRYAR
jgi:hypothetical protein